MFGTPPPAANSRFTLVRLREGYDIADVDALLERVNAGTATSADIQNARFRPVRLKWGYAMGEVDDYLESIERDLRAAGR